jgi:putative membrane protein
MKYSFFLGLAPMLALSACGGHTDNTSTAANTADMTNAGLATDTMAPGTDAANATGNAAMADAAMSPAQKFANDVGASDHYEIEAGKLAQDHAQNKALKDFGGMMVQHHTMSTEKLKAAGAKANPAITPAPVLNAEQEAMLAALQNAKDADFDALYKKQQIAAHEKALATVQAYAASGDVPELKAFAKDAQKLVQSHLTKIKSL